MWKDNLMWINREQTYEHYKAIFELPELSPLLQSGDEPIQIQYWWDAVFTRDFAVGYVSVIKTNKWRRGALFFAKSYSDDISFGTLKPVEIRNDRVFKALKSIDLSVNEDEQIWFGDTGDQYSIQLTTTMLSCHLRMKDRHFFDNRKWLKLITSIYQTAKFITEKTPDLQRRNELLLILARDVKY